MILSPFHHYKVMLGSRKNWGKKYEEENKEEK